MAAKRAWSVLALGGGLAGLWVFACSSPDQPPLETTSPGSVNAHTGATDAGSSGDAAPTCSGSNGGSCNSLFPCGAQVNIVDTATAAPAPKGGTITPGLYELTGFTLYTGSGGATGKQSAWFKQSMQITATSGGSTDGGSGAGDASADAASDAAVTATQTVAYSQVAVVSSASASYSVTSGQFVTSGTSLTTNEDCPGSTPTTSTYSATATTLTLQAFDPSQNTTSESVLTLQP